MTKHVLVTGAAGFIGFHFCSRLLREGYEVTGVDNMSVYYDVNLKVSRLKNLNRICSEVGGKLNFIKKDLVLREDVAEIFEEGRFNFVVNLAAQAGVRYSLENPNSYIDSNISGFLNLLEGCRIHKPEHLIFASSSSVYGMNSKHVFAVDDDTDRPVSLYAATKKSNELMAHAYSHLFEIPSTGLRFFTVYGPYGRPDMAYYKFTKAILEGSSVDVFNYGDMKRDFTYIDDIVEGIFLLLESAPKNQNPAFTKAEAPFKIYNIGNNNPVTLDRFIKAIESATGVKARRNNLPMQPGDVPSTCADITELFNEIGFAPTTPIEVGIEKFVDWYVSYFKSQQYTGLAND